ncbi:uncharacterized protein TRUGW13939_07585 [Talaromyces rugulosus]|uniref:Uncharacterized protein n=1 Tax=Talaromyces rugulosus TaxID=121627 RepID=A0A7H8R231_TALRU|nr:uncharacterized protein TRUGW13939_07585 [Talaromyces rugulosus]QKX60440.1 hypothetical protein TRUGW13939_07585 [Talaromyces rugulosus]
MKVGKVTDHQCRSQQYGLVQQVVESHPIFFLLNVLLQPRREKEIFFVSWPNPTIYALEDSTCFHFPSKPQRTLEEKTLRAIVPISIENIKSCDCILIGTADPRDLRQFMEEYDANVSKPGFEGRKQRGAVLDQEILEQILSTDRYHVKNSPIPLGAVRLLRSTVATSSRGSRYALQPQLLRVRDYLSDEATLENGVSLQDITNHRLSSWPMRQSAYGEKFAESRPPFVHDPLSGISPLAEAIGLRRTFDDYSVLSELGILLGGDLPALQSYVQSWECAANSLVTRRFQTLSCTEQTVYQDKSHSSGQSSQTNIESDVELESEEEKDVEDDYVDEGSADSE